MRVLFLTNFYPPYALGGQELSCKKVVEALKIRKHSTLVLTSMHGTNNKVIEQDQIYRSLFLEMDLYSWRNAIKFFTDRDKREKHNHYQLHHALEKFNPDIVFIWGMWNLPRSLAALAEEKCAGKVVYRFADYWPTLPNQYELYWRTPGNNVLKRIVKNILSKFALKILAEESHQFDLKFENAICVSAATRDELEKFGIPVGHSRIIYNGIDVTKYSKTTQSTGSKNARLDLLYVGRLSLEKGVETILQALHHLVHNHVLDKNIHLTIIGSGSNEYENHLRRLIEELNLSREVSHIGYIPQEHLPSKFSQFDALLVPSLWVEPFAGVVLEGMASGLVVIASSIGGSCEIIENGVNGLLFPPGNYAELSKSIIYLVDNPEYSSKIALAGHATVENRFTQTNMIDNIELYLQEVGDL